MSKPRKTPPHSDIDGVDEDEKRNVDAAIESGQDSGDLAEAREKAHGRPPLTDETTRRGSGG